MFYHPAIPGRDKEWGWKQHLEFTFIHSVYLGHSSYIDCGTRTAIFSPYSKHASCRMFFCFLLRLLTMNRFSHTLRPVVSNSVRLIWKLFSPIRETHRCDVPVKMRNKMISKSINCRTYFQRQNFLSHHFNLQFPCDNDVMTFDVFWRWIRSAPETGRELAMEISTFKMFALCLGKLNSTAAWSHVMSFKFCFIFSLLSILISTRLTNSVNFSIILHKLRGNGILAFADPFEFPIFSVKVKFQMHNLPYNRIVASMPPILFFDMQR